MKKLNTTTLDYNTIKEIAIAISNNLKKNIETLKFNDISPVKNFPINLTTQVKFSKKKDIEMFGYTEHIEDGVYKVSLFLEKKDYLLEEIYLTLVHEITHIKQDFEYGFFHTNKDYYEGESYTAYINQPAEAEPFFNQIVQECAFMVHNLNPLKLQEISNKGLSEITKLAKFLLKTKSEKYRGCFYRLPNEQKEKIVSAVVNLIIKHKKGIDLTLKNPMIQKMVDDGYSPYNGLEEEYGNLVSAVQQMIEKYFKPKRNQVESNEK